MAITHLYSAIEESEGFRDRPYRDTKGLWTVGIGACVERSPLTASQWRTLLDAGLIEVKLSHQGARLLMMEKLNQIERSLSDTIPEWYKIDEARRHVLIEMAYQLGASFIYDFKIFTAAVSRRDWPEAAKAGLDSKWAKIDTPARAQRLMEKLKTGEW